MRLPVGSAEEERADGFAVSGLVDCSCAVTGYRESPLDDPGDSARAIAELLLRHGVAAVRDLGSGLDATGRFAAHAKGRVAVVGGGPVLVDAAPRAEGDRPVRDADQVRRALDGLVAEEVGWVTVRATQPEFLADVSRAARERGLRVAARGGTALAGACSGQVDLVEGLVALAGSEAGRRPVEALTRLADSDPGPLSDRLLRAGAAGAAVVTELVALRRAAFVKESLSAPYLDDLIPILPHVRYMMQMRRSGGYLAGKRALARYSGLAEPSGSVLRQAERGWAVLLEAAARAAAAGVPLLPGSKAPQLAVVPGYGLREEIAVLVFAGVDARTALSAATDGAARWLGLDPAVLAGVRLVRPGPPVTPEDVLDLTVAGATGPA
jgi:hypothetical protein